MACLLVPASAAILVSGAKKKIPAELHPERLELMLWGGTAMLIVDHLMTGELVPYPPFLTAMNNPADTATMFHEIATTGVLMTVLVFAIWMGIILIEKASLTWREKRLSRKVL